nr:UvrD-helicase domain-containing protein [Desulfocucumis palustris]
MFIADFHIHSKYSRATSRECVPEILDLWARRKGLGLIGTGDFSHPAWRRELREKLIPSEEGLYTLKDDFRKEDDVMGAGFKPRFIVSGEISSIYKKNGKVRKVHNLLLLPSLEHAEALSHRLEAIGNLHSDGRPILGLDSRDLLEITLDVCADAIFIPAHIWTPHFSLFGAYSGFDDIRECFGDLTDYIHALETGLSSDPPMNWRLSALDRFTLVSNSDAHSPGNLGREANLFDTSLSYPHIALALQDRDAGGFYGTIEFFPEEGKYHYDGHRNCKVCLKPADTNTASGICPVCGGRLTVGVLHRVEALADRAEGFVSPAAKHFESLVPLHEVIAASTGLTAASVKVRRKYNELMRELGPEFFILRQAPLGDIELKAGPLVAEGIRRLRLGKVEIKPGYDGEYGKIKILDKSEIGLFSGQLCLFNEKKDKEQLMPKDAGDKKDPLGKAVPGPVLTDARPQEKDLKAAPRFSPEIPHGLNREQREAVCAAAPAVAVIAGPGTGKTKTLVSRVAHLVENCGVSPSGITAVTFTNKAAGEMRERLAKHFGNRRTVKAMNIGTFHSVCLQILSRQNGKENITVIDEYDALPMVGDILKSLGLKNSPRDVLRGISLIKSGAWPGEAKTDMPSGVYELYCAQLERYGVLDYDDILLNVLRPLERGDAGRMEDKSLRDSWSHLLVDEFQDINMVQYRLIREWSRNSASIFVIGDPDQSIYGFRGAEPRCFERFFKDFPCARQIRLIQNYRSTPEIIRCALSVISRKTAGGSEPALEAKRESGVKARLLEAEDEFGEARFVAREISRMVGGIDMLDAHSPSKKAGPKRPASGCQRGFSDIAVLYRTNRQSEILEQCLLKEGIPYVVAGRGEFLAEPQIRRAVAFFRFLLNPRALVSLRLCLKASVSCPAELVREIIESYAGSGKNAADLAGILEGLLPSHDSDSLRKFIELLRKYEPLVSGERPQKLIESWISDNALGELKCMELFLHTAVLHESMPSLLQNLLLGRESDVTRSGGRKYRRDAVSLMTLHGAKGLEFPAVFLCGVKDGMIPLKNSRDDNNPEEERRLFYVGLTRARDELILLTSRPRSPFLSDMSEECLVTEDALARRQAPAVEQFRLFDV